MAPYGAEDYEVYLGGLPADEDNSDILNFMPTVQVSLLLMYIYMSKSNLCIHKLTSGLEENVCYNFKVMLGVISSSLIHRMGQLKQSYNASFHLKVINLSICK